MPAASEVDQATTARGLLIDFGGVLTSPISEAFGALDGRLHLPEGLALRLLAENEAVRTAFVAHEKGDLPTAGFEEVYARELSVVSSADVEPAGLLREVGARMRIVPEMLELVREVRAAGIPVALVSNSLGDGGYDAVDLPATFDVTVISAEVGARKPSRRIYQEACDRLGLSPEVCVLVDDLQQNVDGASRLGVLGVLHRTPSETRERLHLLFGIPSHDDGRPVTTAQGE